MRSDAPFGAYLSGGVDSSAVVDAMVKHSSQRIRTFSVGFHEVGYSEVSYARRVSRHLDTDHHELLIDSDPFFGNGLPPSAIGRLPSARPQTFPFYCSRRRHPPP